MAEIHLSNGMIALADDSDLPILANRRWHHKDGYAVANARRDGKRIQVRMHRLILGDDARESTDHRNGNKLDNRRENLRACTKSENGMNRSAQANSTSGYKGVTFCRRSGTWQAQIMVKRRNHFLGRFKTPEQAFEAYKVAAQRLHGEFAKA